jgi:hypothetical protein
VLVGGAETSEAVDLVDVGCYDWIEMSIPALSVNLGVWRWGMSLYV